MLFAKVSQLTSALREKGEPDIEAEKLIENTLKDIGEFIKKIASSNSNDMEA